jgi:hypothetical protein
MDKPRQNRYWWQIHFLWGDQADNCGFQALAEGNPSVFRNSPPVSKVAKNRNAGSLAVIVTPRLTRLAWNMSPKRPLFAGPGAAVCKLAHLGMRSLTAFTPPPSLQRPFQSHAGLQRPLQSHAELIVKKRF